MYLATALGFPRKMRRRHERLCVSYTCHAGTAQRFAVQEPDDVQRYVEAAQALKQQGCLKKLWNFSGRIQVSRF